MDAGLVVSIDGGLKLTAHGHPRINYRELENRMFL